MAKETHRAVVVWVCGVPFVVRDGKEVAQLLRLSARLPRLEERADGTLATLTEAATNALENQMVLRIEVRDVECTDCDERKDEGMSPQRDSTVLSSLLEDMLGTRRRSTH